MTRLWDVKKDEEARAVGADAPNVQALQNALDRSPTWTVDDVKVEVGGTGRGANRALATELLALKGNDSPTSRQISSQMKAIQRWENYQRGTSTGNKQSSAKPSKAAQDLLNRAGRNAQAAQKGFTVAMQGDIGVDSYRRHNRSATVNLSGQLALDFLENPNYETLASAYGVGELEGYGDSLLVDLNWS